MVKITTENEYLKSSKVRLRTVIDGFLQENIKWEQVVELFQKWRNQNEYGVLDQIQEDGGRKLILFKLAKRGNDVYRFRLLKRLEPFLRNKQFKLKLAEMHGCFITLTFNPEWVREYGVWDKVVAWKEISKRWNLFLTKLRKKFPYLFLFRVWESTKKGYPHIHFIIYFQEFVYIPQEWLQQQWGAYVWIEAIRHPIRTFHYLVKYLIKTHEDPEHIITLVSLWLFRKRAFSIHLLFDLIPYMHNSNSNLCNAQVKFAYLFLGIVILSEQIIALDGKLPWQFVCPKAFERQVLDALDSGGVVQF